MPLWRIHRVYKHTIHECDRVIFFIDRDPPRAMSLEIMLTPTEGRLNRYEVQVTL